MEGLTPEQYYDLRERVTSLEIQLGQVRKDVDSNRNAQLRLGWIVITLVVGGLVKALIDGTIAGVS